MNILIVDDERTALNDLEKVLQSVAPGSKIYTAGLADEALQLCRDICFDVAFMDIQMPGKDGLSLARELKEVQPMLNIVMVTAYQEYAYDALRLYVSDYILKPAMPDDVRRALGNLRHPVADYQKGLYVQCFGNFEVFYDGRVVSFGRAKAKEMFAYMIDRKGASSTNAELCSVLWEDEGEKEHSSYFAQVVHALRMSLKELDCEDVFVHSRNVYAVAPDRISCDYYNFLAGDPQAAGAYRGEYMTQYSWAEITRARLYFSSTKEKD